MERQRINVEITTGDKISYAAYRKNFKLDKSVGFIDESVQPLSLAEYSQYRKVGIFKTALEAVDDVRYTSRKEAHDFTKQIRAKMKELKITSVDYEGSRLVNVIQEGKMQTVREKFKGKLDLTHAYSPEFIISRLRGYELYSIVYQLFGDTSLADEIYGY